MTVALQWTTFLDTVLVVAPTKTIIASKVIDILDIGKASGVVMTPSLIEAICLHPRGIKQLQSLNYVYFAGAPLSRQVAEKLVGHCKVQPGIGSTEAGAYFVEIRNDDDWEYYRFRPAMGVQLEKRTEGLYELVFHRRPELERWQQVFQVFPHLDQFPTKDLWARHPLKPDLWRYAGRLDDLVILSSGANLDTSLMEAEIEKSEEVKVAVIGGQGRPYPFLLVELVNNQVLSKSEKALKLDRVWPYVEEANKPCVDKVRLLKEFVIFTDAGDPLPRTAKGTVSRQSSFKLYASEIDMLYTAA